MKSLTYLPIPIVDWLIVKEPNPKKGIIKRDNWSDEHPYGTMHSGAKKLRNPKPVAPPPGLQTIIYVLVQVVLSSQCRLGSYLE